MPRKTTRPPRPTTAELDLLRVIWRLGPATVREIHEARAEGTSRHRLRHRAAPDAGDARQGPAGARRTPALARLCRRARAGRAADQPARELIHKAFAGSGKDLVLAALSEHVTDREREEIVRFLNEHPAENDDG